MTLAASPGHVAGSEEIRTLRAVRRMAADTALHLDWWMLIRERAGECAVAFCAGGVLLRNRVRGPGRIRAGIRAVGLMAIRAAHLLRATGMRIGGELLHFVRVACGAVALFAAGGGQCRLRCCVLRGGSRQRGPRAGESRCKQKRRYAELRMRPSESTTLQHVRALEHSGANAAGRSTRATRPCLLLSSTRGG